MGGGGERYCDISQVEVVGKVVTVILNCRFATSVAFHNILHGFWEGHGTGTASHEAKMIQQLTGMREEVVYTIFLDL